MWMPAGSRIKPASSFFHHRRYKTGSHWKPHKNIYILLTICTTRCGARFCHRKLSQNNKLTLWNTEKIVIKLVFPLRNCHFEIQIFCWIVPPLTRSLAHRQKTSLRHVKTSRSEVLLTIGRQNDKQVKTWVSADERKFLPVTVRKLVLQSGGWVLP